jgi:UDP-N-acetylmuramate--alanine ligase
VIGKASGVTIVDDYAHHPTEVKYTIEAARLGWNGTGKIIVVFQPHRYTRTRDLMVDFATAFDKADELILTDIYSADEVPIAGVTARDLSEKIQTLGACPVHYIGRKESVAQYLLPKLDTGDLVLFTGAGDIYHSAKEIYALLHDQEQCAKQNV